MKKLIISIKFLSIVLLSFLAAISSAQDITNTLGLGGTFTIKNSSTNYFTVSPAGQVNVLRTLRLENTTNSTTGVLYFGVNRFMHNYGNSNTFLGDLAGNFTLTGSYNTGAGSGVFTNLTSGSYNSGMGFSTLGRVTSGSENTAYGYGSLNTLTAGSYNTAFGSMSLLKNTASYNSAMGYLSLQNNTTGTENAAVGYYTLSTNTTGSWNSAFGSEALQLSTMNFNTAIGYLAGYFITTGAGNVCVGYNSQPSSNNSVNQFTIGNNQVTSLRCNVTTITSLSDARDKKNITNLPLGINFIMSLKPRQYNWDKREWYENGISDGTKKQELPTAGFIAQELDEAQTNAGAEWLNLVLKDNPEKFEASAGNLLPVVVKAIQELQVENEKMQNINLELKNKNVKYKELLDKTKQMQNILQAEIEKIRSKHSEEIMNTEESK